jgi:hypothetical protein
LFPFVADSKKKQEDVDKDITKEFKAQAKFLENSNKKLQYQLNQRQTLHKEDNLNIMNENVQLIADVSHLRNEVKVAKDRIKDIGGANALEKIKATQEAMNAAESQVADSNRGGRHAAADDELEQVDGFDNSLHKNLAIKKKYIQQLRDQY